MKFFYLLLVIIVFTACTNTCKKNQVYIPPDEAQISKNLEDYLEYNRPVLSNVILDNPDNLNIFRTEIFVHTLRINDGRFTDLTPLINLCFLEELQIKKLGKFDDISPLSTLTNLKKLHLVTYADDDFDLSPIAELTNLEELYLFANIKDITPLRTLVNLKKLELPDISGCDSILPFSQLINLRELKIGHEDDNNTFTELLPLQQLEVLNIHAFGSGELNISNIVQLQKLKKLRIFSNRTYFQIKNISNLRNLTNLEVLEITHSGNIDLSFVRRLKDLHTLEVRKSIINDVSPLLDLPNLVDLSLWNSKVRDFSPLLNHPSIKRITGFDDDFVWLPVYDKFKEQGVEFWSGIADSK